MRYIELNIFHFTSFILLAIRPLENVKLLRAGGQHWFKRVSEAISAKRARHTSLSLSICFSANCKLVFSPTVLLKITRSGFLPGPRSSPVLGVALFPRRSSRGLGRPQAADPRLSRCRSEDARLTALCADLDPRIGQRTTTSPCSCAIGRLMGCLWDWPL